MPSTPETAAGLAREFAKRFSEQSFREAADLLSDAGHERVVKSYPDEFQHGPTDAVDVLDGYWWGLYSRYGDIENVEVAVEGDEVAVDHDVGSVEFTLAEGSVTATVGVDEDGVTDFAFAPEWTVPEYLDGDAFTERDVTVDAGDVNLGGVLAIPDGDGPFPGVVLVHGAGVHDPDGTAGATKLLKDVAWGLVSEGIAVLRYEKRLLDHDVPDENYTLDRIVVDDAIAAVEELASAAEVADDSVFVAGHSQGGMCVPRIAARHGGVAGVVVLDGLPNYSVDPDAEVEFMRYNMDPYGDLSEEQEAQLDTQREAFQRLADGDFETDETILGRPGAYHQSRLGFDPAGTVADLGAPAFVAGTERLDHDHQRPLVEMSREGFEKWQAVEAADGSRFEYYEDVGHYFREGPVPHTREGLYFGGNVAAYVVGDVADWVHDVADD